MQLVKFNEGARAVTATNAKTGAVTTRLMTAKEFKEVIRARPGGDKLSAKQMKEEFNAYIKTGMAGNTADLAAALTSGRIGITGVTFNDKSGKGVIRFIDTDTMKAAEVTEVERKLANMDAEELKAVLEKAAELMKAHEAVNA